MAGFCVPSQTQNDQQKKQMSDPELCQLPASNKITINLNYGPYQQKLWPLSNACFRPPWATLLRHWRKELLTVWPCLAFSSRFLSGTFRSEKSEKCCFRLETLPILDWQSWSLDFLRSGCHPKRSDYQKYRNQKAMHLEIMTWRWGRLARRSWTRQRSTWTLSSTRLTSHLSTGCH